MKKAQKKTETRVFAKRSEKVWFANAEKLYWRADDDTATLPLYKLLIVEEGDAPLDYEEIDIASPDTWQLVYEAKDRTHIDRVFKAETNNYVFYRKTFWQGDIPYGYIIPADRLIGYSFDDEKRIKEVFAYLFSAV